MMQSKLTTLTQTADDLAYTQQWQRQEHGAQRSCEMEKTTQVNRPYLLLVLVTELYFCCMLRFQCHYTIHTEMS